MSNRWPGGLIRKTPVTPAGPLQNGAAPGMWTLAEAAFWTKQGLWPIAGNFLAVEDVFSTWLYTGNGSTQTITNGIDLAGKGGLVWIKSRSAGGTSAYDHFLTYGDFTKFLRSNTTQTAFSTSTFTSSSSGFNLLNGYTQFNENAVTYASWTFREAPNFFDVVTYTGNGVAGRQIAHNLGSVPGMMIVKMTSAVEGWYVYHRGTSSPATKTLVLNNTNAENAGSVGYWNSTAPTSTNFTLGSNYEVNNNGSTYVAYLFAHDAGGFGPTGTDNIISCGSFTSGLSGNASVTLGWEPQWLLYKPSSGTGNWIIKDNMRGYNLTQLVDLYPNLSAVEDVATTSNVQSPTATGFAFTTALIPSTTYIYVAIRRGPMRTPTLGTSVFSPLAVTASTGTARTTGFPVDLSMAKTRTISFGNLVTDSLRGFVNDTSAFPPTLITSSTAAESTSNQPASYAFNNTGYLDGQSTSGYPTAYWNFRRAPGFFDEVCYTGSNSDITIPHNLTVKPELIIVKARNNARDWAVILPSIVTGTSSGTNFSTGSLNRTNALIRRNYGGDSWLTQDVTSTNLFFEGNAAGGNAEINFGGWTYVAYLFASVPGVSKVGSYTGNGSSQTINCAFTTGARFVLIKRTDSTGDWYVWDSARGIVAGNDPYLALNSAAAEVTSDDSVDTDNTGFVVNQVAASNINVNAATYIFLAIA